MGVEEGEVGWQVGILNGYWLVESGTVGIQIDEIVVVDIEIEVGERSSVVRSSGAAQVDIFDEMNGKRCCIIRWV